MKLKTLGNQEIELYCRVCYKKLVSIDNFNGELGVYYLMRCNCCRWELWFIVYDSKGGENNNGL